MKVTFCTILVLLFTPVKLWAQDSTKFRLYAKFHPLAAINPERPSIVGSLEFRFFRTISLEVGYGRRYAQGVFPFYDLDTITVEPDGNIKFLELTWYNPFGIRSLNIKNKAKLNGFLGVTYRQIYDVCNASKGYYSKDNNGEYRFDCYAVERRINIYALRAGAILTYKFLTAEVYAEAGVRHKNMIFLYSEMNTGQDSYPGALMPYERKFNGWLPSVNIGAKICFQVVKI